MCRWALAGTRGEEAAVRIAVVEASQDIISASELFYYCQMKTNSGKLKPVASNLNSLENITTLFMHKKAYDAHLRKLSEIRTKRKNSLQTQSIRREQQIEQFKRNRQYNFAFRYNEEALDIEQQNFRLFNRLSQEKNNKGAKVAQADPVFLRTKRSLDTSSVHSRIESTEEIKKKNRIMRERIKSSQSCLAKSVQLHGEERKRQEIRNRISRYKNSELKAQICFKSIDQARKPTQSQTSRNGNMAFSPYSNSRPRDKKSEKIERRTASFYTHKEILSNKIERFQKKTFLPKNTAKNQTGYFAQQTSDKPNRKKLLSEKFQSMFPTEVS